MNFFMSSPGTYTIQRFSECLQTQHSWGSETFYNLCTGNHNTVPWGGLDYFANIALVGGSSLVMLLITGMIALGTYATYMEAKDY